MLAIAPFQRSVRAVSPGVAAALFAALSLPVSGNPVPREILGVYENDGAGWSDSIRIEPTSQLHEVRVSIELIRERAMCSFRGAGQWKDGLLALTDGNAEARDERHCALVLHFDRNEVEIRTDEQCSAQYCGAQADMNGRWVPKAITATSTAGTPPDVAAGKAAAGSLSE